MCGRFKRKPDKQKVAQVFEVQAGLEEADFAPGDDLRPQSMQPVIYTNKAGERQIEMVGWGFKLPAPLLFNARSESIAQANCRCEDHCSDDRDENAYDQAMLAYTAQTDAPRYLVPTSSSSTHGPDYVEYHHKTSRRLQ